MVESVPGGSSICGPPSRSLWPHRPGPALTRGSRYFSLGKGARDDQQCYFLGRLYSMGIDGGFGPFSSHYGLKVDQILGAAMVNPYGKRILCMEFAALEVLFGD